jgi:hypothetical protein
MAENTAKATEDRIRELEGQLQAVEATHTAQAKRGDDLEATLKEMHAKHEFQRKRADKAEAKLKLAPGSPAGDHVVLEGRVYPIVGSFRADNTFVEVKRGHCDEGITLVAIQKAF